MKFVDALCLLNSGRHIRREAWAKTYYIVIKNDYIYACICHKEQWQEVEKKPFDDRFFTMNDVLAEDWVEYRDF